MVWDCLGGEWLGYSVQVKTTMQKKYYYSIL